MINGVRTFNRMQLHYLLQSSAPDSKKLSKKSDFVWKYIIGFNLGITGTHTFVWKIVIGMFWAALPYELQKILPVLVQLPKTMVLHIERSVPIKNTMNFGPQMSTCANSHFFRKCSLSRIWHLNPNFTIWIFKAYNQNGTNYYVAWWKILFDLKKK